MEKFEQLSKIQQGLVNGLINEFTKINPKPSNGIKRFSFETISDCMKEEERFKETIAKHNKTMMKVFVDQLKSDVKEFKKEFGKVLEIEMGYQYKNQSEKNDSLEKLIAKCDKDPIANNYSTEIKLFFVSKTKRYGNDSSYNYFDNKAYHGVYVNFKRERVEIVLESGKSVTAFKIVGLMYKTKDWLNNDKEHCKKYSTLDEMIQSDKSIQQNIVLLAQ